MPYRSTIILVILAVAGVFAAVWVERHGPATGTAQQADARLLFDAGALPVDDVNRITLDRGDDHLEFVRRDDRWWQTEPFEHPMKTPEIRQILRRAAELSIVDELDAGGAGSTGTAATLGLDPAAATLRLGWPEGSVRLLLGRRGIAGRSYLRKGGDPAILVVNDDLHERALEQDPVLWRDPTLFDAIGVEADRIEIASGDDLVVLVRDRRTWRMEQPVRTRVNDVAFEGLVQALARAKASAFVRDDPEDLSRFGLSTPAGSIAVTMSRVVEAPAGDAGVKRESTTQRLLIGARAGVGTQDRFGMIEGRRVIARLPEKTLGAVFLRPTDLAAATGSGVNAADVKAIRVSSTAGEFRLQRDVRRWIAPDHDNKEVEPARVGSLLEMLTEVRAGAVEIGAYPRDIDVATITLIGFDSRPIDTVRVAREKNGQRRWILENGDGVLRFFPSNFALGLDPRDYGLTR
ncbi:MAG: DUF4340 domain-containing protein [Planctomycetes bacterium]|nr:DUF4340 domain-containing protein [Planctomycetota bacterium]